ncbi:MAG: FtsW/RodA/SpoVE family cell cycle protein [Coprococcus sp.]|jgi:cell division protein FtsW|nr:FtsW/RodA/SpoVE family cell cycle protein [Coprococcus sp.]
MVSNGQDMSVRGKVEQNGQIEKKGYTYTPGVEIKIVVAVVFLMAFGLIMIFSASSYTSSISRVTNYDSAYYFKKQLKVMALGVIIAAFLNWVPYKLIKKCGILAYVISLVLIVMLKTPLGINSGGATRWLNLGFMQLQVADATKVCMIVFMGWYVNRFWKEFDKFRYTLILWLLVALQAGLILKISSNLSSCLILMLMVFILTFIVGKHPKTHLIIAAVGIVVIVIFIMWLKANMPLDSEMDKYPYQIRRFFGWLDPERYAGTLGYQPLQSLYAIGSGGLLGKGLGNGTQKLSNIPEAQNDMIFAIICEELGLIGVIIMFLMFGYLLYQMVIVVKESRNIYASVVVIGVILHIIFQIIVNVCVAVNFFPNTGVSLPFISAGGSAIICTLMEIGLVIGIRRQQVNRKYSRIS